MPERFSDERLESIKKERLSKFSLARLERFARLAAAVDASNIPQFSILARHATLSAYRDCVALGLETEARHVLERNVGQKASQIDPTRNKDL